VSRSKSDPNDAIASGRSVSKPPLKAIVLIPSRYDRKGVMVYRLGLMPNSTAGFVAGMCEDYNRRHPDGHRIDWSIFDEHVETSVTEAILQEWKSRAADGRLLLLVAGVQTNNYPRARDICLTARKLGIAVVAGGVHLSCHGPSVEFLLSCGVSVSLGEAEPFFDEILDDALAQRLKPLYRIGDGEGISVKTSASDIRVPELTRLPFPAIPPSYIRKFVRRQVHVDSSRGCPFLCTFCAVKNAFGRSVRSRDPEELVAWMADQVRTKGIRWFDFTDDNFTRSPRHLEVLEGLARLREEEGLRFSVKMMLDVESACYVHHDSARGRATREFLDLCQRAGVRKVYIGIETTTPEAMREINKAVNRPRHTNLSDAHKQLIERFHVCMEAWHSIGATVGSIIMLGLDADTRESGVRGARDATAIGVDYAFFAWVTPLPGAENYARAVERGTLRHHDFNSYFYEPVLRHPTLGVDDLVEMVDEGTQAFYSLGNVAHRIKSAVFDRARPRTVAPVEYITRQILPMIGNMSRLFVMQQVTGGILRRGARHCAARVVVTDEEARAHYLPGVEVRPRTLPASMLDDGNLESLPILQHHELDRAASRARLPAA
jgi:radical SAM superfamily enzyme YgiQ (UPF0313 family)